LAEIAFTPVFPDDAVERERRIALDDVAQVRDDMHRFPLSLMLGAAFPEHAYGFSLETLETALGAVQRDHIVAWHQQRVAGNEPWVVVVGDVHPDAVAAVVAASVPSVQRVNAPSQQAPAWPRERIEVYAEKERAQTAIAIGLPGPPRDDDDRFPLLLAATAVGGLGGRVFEELRSKRSLAYVVSLRPIARRAGGAFVGYIATSPDREAEARDALLAEMTRLAEVGVAVDELERARTYTLGAWDIRRQTSAALAADLVGALVIGDGLEELRRFHERVRAVTPEAVRDAARKWLDPNRAVIGVVRGRP
jgi:zinc protease